MMKPICIVDQDTTIKALHLKMGELQNTAKEQMKFIEKRAEKVHQTLNDDMQKVWREIEQYCEDAGLVKNAKKTNMSFQRGVLLAGDEKDGCDDCGEDHDDLPGPLKALLSFIGRNPEST